MASNTTRLELPYPEGGDRPPDVAQALQQLSQKLDELAMIRGQGIFADRPTDNIAGRMYWATDKAQMYFDNGTTWIALGPAVELPIGGVLDWPATTNPPGPATWLELNGDPITRGTYPELFAAWNLPGQNANLPDRRGRSPMGAGKGPGLENRVVGDRPGEEKHRILKDELPSYQLPVSDPGHFHAYDRPAGRIAQWGSDPDHASYTGAGSNTQIAWTGISVSSGGRGDLMNVIHPVLVTRYFVRAR